MTAAWVQALAARLGARLIETHISWVLLAGDTALKIKKPVTLPFVDYGSLAARRHCCEEELRLNRRLAPGLYRDVVPITGTAAQPRLGGDGPALDYALRMRRFADGMLFSELLPAGALQAAEVDELAALLADFHTQAPIAGSQDGFGTPEGRRDLALAACAGAATALQADLSDLHGWLQARAAELQPLWAARLAAGRVREGHGDLHLANLVRLDGGVAAFDGIEFDPALRWIDVLDDIAFAVMDFAAAGHRAFAFRLLNHWLDATGDHDGLPALPFACAYRALVRAQAHALRADAPQARAYVEAARSWTTLPTPRLAITFGLPGSGKTWRSQQWLERHGAIRLRSDVERKRLAGLGMLDDSRAAGLDLYTADMGARTYERLFTLARTALTAGLPVVLDAAFLRRAERDRARALAKELGAPFSILACEAPPEVLRQRLRERRGDASEADESVLARLTPAAEPLGAEELVRVEPA
ncbi:AAA family ATPase [Ramlibacter tataouinensis]|uniref:bifunctional aminoglycoside phosphotransferase/ATP-binding protein n=1 Tax=Ramlibacter tataouinensis TaxID=94132 RepID=UPI0022F3D10B|nr:bifunctional aminoglycoside phosphotransferase/ATP-binding protein [Ramlibacter tataouinensis]WBY02580.1 AAA family ATPase [Ramlibacter tataouinensis]